MGGGIRARGHDEYRNGALILDLVEPAKQELMWHATTGGAPEDTVGNNIEIGNNAITKTFQDSPPKKQER